MKPTHTPLPCEHPNGASFWQGQLLSEVTINLNVMAKALREAEERLAALEEKA